MISTHVLDTSTGRPAAGVNLRLAVQRDDEWHELVRAATDADGRVARLLPIGAALAAGLYRLTFEVGSYFRRLGIDSFYSDVTVEFIVRDPDTHHHVPLLVSPYGYSTYRGS